MTLCNPLDYSTPGFPVFHYPLEFAQTHDHWVSDAIQPSHLLLPPSLPVLNLSWHQGLFQWVSLCIRWPKCWSFGFSISPSNEYLGLISFRTERLNDVSCRFLIFVIKWGSSLLFLICWEILLWVDIESYLKFFCKYCEDHVIFLLYSVNLVIYITWFLNIELVLHS